MVISLHYYRLWQNTLPSRRTNSIFVHGCHVAVVVAGVNVLQCQDYCRLEASDWFYPDDDLPIYFFWLTFLWIEVVSVLCMSLHNVLFLSLATIGGTCQCCCLIERSWKWKRASESVSEATCHERLFISKSIWNLSRVGRSFDKTWHHHGTLRFNLMHKI